MKNFSLTLVLVWISLVFLNSASAQETTQGMSTEVLEGFENPDTWDVRFSSQRCSQWEQNVLDMKPASEPPSENTDSQKELAWIRWFNIDSFPENLRNNIRPRGIPHSSLETEKTILGVKGCWQTQGFNWVSIQPKSPLFTDETPIALSLWVWGSNYNYDLYIVVKNELGFFYNLYLGSLNYFGWRNLRINIPSYVFSSSKHRISNRLQIISLKVIGTIGEDSTGFYTYFDYMQALYGFSHRVFDGNSLTQNRW